MHCIYQQTQFDITENISNFLRSLYLDHLVQLLVLWVEGYLSEDGCQGTSNDLLLDAWWLEFWELILLAAGDIERNPGPITGKLISLNPGLISYRILLMFR